MVKHLKENCTSGHSLLLVLCLRYVVNSGITIFLIFKSIRKHIPGENGEAEKNMKIIIVFIKLRMIH